MKEFLKNLWKLLIIIGCIGILIGSFILGRKSVECQSILVKPDTIFYTNSAEINRLQKWIKEQDKQIEFYIKQRDSLETLISKKNETKIIYLDTTVNTIILEWANKSNPKF